VSIPSSESWRRTHKQQQKADRNVGKLSNHVKNMEKSMKKLFTQLQQMKEEGSDLSHSGSKDEDSHFQFQLAQMKEKGWKSDDMVSV
jgi:septal ring factor EnvC (AmiA/AmiB activator)